ncbi:hypothetical protein ERD78_18895 [Allopusillimonas soli]|uniref:Concanavalin A-like lectin/glucanase superfamily protein n=1 Tax=Allopusillimonas soli TaxID=659016 RepID=A0A853FFL1_9BURK|nr:alanine-zipper protein [Allopusillimonas soli]NYT38863.1 hypothetical protein [Allopusillimonas soli]TEA70137.1 hypothetical protein ERD78_18895 [Allopusillimonas soli]
MPLVLRNEKGSPLTNAEVDGNFTYLDDKADSAQSAADTAQNTANLAGQAAQQAQDTADAAGQAADEAQAGVDTLAVQSAFERDNLRAMLMQSRYGDGPYPTIDWQFAGASRLDPRITFSRASADTIYNASGKLVTLGADVPAFPYDPATGRALGFRVQAQATNCLNGSGVPTEYGFVRGNITEQATFAGYKMAKYAPTAEVGEHFVEKSDANTTAVGTLNSAQMVVKPAEVTSIAIRLAGASVQWCTVDFSVSPPAISTPPPPGQGTVSATPLADGVYLLKLEGIPTAQESGRHYLRAQAQNTGDYDGTKGFWFGGFMLEQGAAKCSSYIETPSGSQGTRAADSAIIAGSDFSDWFNPSEGTFVIDAKWLSKVGTNSYLLGLSDGTTNSFLGIRINSGNTLEVGFTTGAGVQTIKWTTPALPLDLKVAVSYKEGRVAFVKDGELVGSSPFSVTTFDRAELCGLVNTQSFGAQAISKAISYYPLALSDTQLEALTS